jgi:hypothetical protein
MFRADQQQQQQRGLQALAIPDPADMGSIILRGAQTFARRHKYLTGSYLLGLVVLLFFSSGIKLSHQQITKYNQIMESIDQQAEFDASQHYYRTRQAYAASKGWFFACDGLCQRNKQRMQVAELDLKKIRHEGNARMSHAKAVAGIFSQVAADEAKETFWQYFNSGKQFAKRQTMWDVMFLGMRSMTRGRDEGWMEFALKVLVQLLINLSMGLFMALIFFVCSIYSIVKSYQANPVFAVLFFVGASCAAFAFVASYLMAVYGAAATAVYGVVKLAETSQRARIADQRRAQGIGYGNHNRPHYE